MGIRDVEGGPFICRHPELVNIYDCKIGAGTKIGAFVEIGKGVEIGEICKIQSGAFIPEGVVIGHEVFIGPNVTFCNAKYPMTDETYGLTKVKDRAIIGAGAVILPNLFIGEGCIIGAGSVVTHNVSDYSTVAGNPAREV